MDLGKKVLRHVRVWATITRNGTIDILHQIIIVVAHSVEHIGSELLRTKRLANGGKCVSHTHHFVEVVGDCEIMKLHLPKRSANGVTRA